MRARRGAVALALALAFAVAWSADARAAEPIGTLRLSADLHHYFDGEYREGFAFTLAGAGASVASSLLLEGGSDLGRGASIPLLAVGFIQLGAGIVLHGRTPNQVAKLDALLAADPAALKAVETKRMKRVVVQFFALEVVEITLCAGGGALAVAGGVLEKDMLLGAGIGLAIQAAVMLSLDYLAHRRASRYLDSLRRFDPAR